MRSRGPGRSRAPLPRAPAPSAPPRACRRGRRACRLRLPRPPSPPRRRAYRARPRPPPSPRLPTRRACRAAAPPRRRPAARRPPSGPRGLITLGDAAFDAGTGVLARLGDLELIGPRLDVWRAPTDNDEGYHGPEQLAALWRTHGLDRMRHRTRLGRGSSGDTLLVRTRVAAAASDLGLDATYAWTAHERAARRSRSRSFPTANGSFPLPAPRRALRGPARARPRGVVRPRAGGGVPGQPRSPPVVGRFSAARRRAADAVPDAAGERRARRRPLGGAGRPSAPRGPPALRADASVRGRPRPSPPPATRPTWSRTTTGSTSTPTWRTRAWARRRAAPACCRNTGSTARPRRRSA